MLKSLYTVISLLLLVQCIYSISVPYQLCQNIQYKNQQIVKIESIDANVWPPKAGELLSIKASGRLSEPLDAATYHITVSYDDLVVLDKKGDVSEYIELPLKSNELITVEKSQKLPQQIPDGDVLLNAVVYDSKQNMILCIDISATLGNNNNDDTITIIPDMSSFGFLQRMKQDTNKQIKVLQPITSIDIIKSTQYNNNHKDNHMQDELIDDEGKEIEFQLCGDENDSIQIQSLRASDWPLVPGKPLTLYVTANVLNEITSGTYEAKVLFDGLQVIDKKDTLTALGVTLPLQPGINKFSKQFDVPKNLPQGNVQLSAVAHNNDGIELVCATIELDV